MDLTTITTEAPIVVVQSLKSGGDTTALQKILSEIMPNFVILYTADISTVRQLEVKRKSKKFSFTLEKKNLIQLNY